jgi:hypothetical protein
MLFQRNGHRLRMALLSEKTSVQGASQRKQVFKGLLRALSGILVTWPSATQLLTVWILETQFLSSCSQGPEHSNSVFEDFGNKHVHELLKFTSTTLSLLLVEYLFTFTFFHDPWEGAEINVSLVSVMCCVLCSFKLWASHVYQNQIFLYLS